MLTIINKNKQTELYEKLVARSRMDYPMINEAVLEIIKQVKTYGDEALISYTKAFDGAMLSSFRVSDEAIKDAYRSMDPILIEDLKKAMINIEFYHEKQKIQPFEYTQEPGIKIGQKVSAISSVGIYVPGGTASYPSTVLMNAIPAKIAGVKRIVIITPPDTTGKVNPTILAAAYLCGIYEIYSIGGAQGIAALAYGTQSIPKVAKIVGPGNMYVAMAKKLVSGDVGIDMIAGPSEVLIIADQYANPSYIACDLMAQAEHDPYAASILVTNSIELARNVNLAIEKEIKSLSRKSIIENAFNNVGAIIVVDDLDEAVAISNRIAPEHLEILTRNYDDILKDIEHAGSIFLGSYTPEPVGDYYAGPNHTLPTSGTATFSSALSVNDFMKKSSYVYYSKEALNQAKDSIIRLAESERLTAHARAISIRFDQE